MAIIDDQSLNVYFLIFCGKSLNILILVCFVLGILRPTKSHFVACTSNHLILIVMVGVVVQSLLFRQIITRMKYKSLVFFLKVLVHPRYSFLSILSCYVSISAQVFLLILF